LGIKSVVKREAKVLSSKLPKFEPYFFSDFEHGSDENRFGEESGTWVLEEGVYKETTTDLGESSVPGTEVVDVEARFMGQSRASSNDPNVNAILRFVDVDNYYFAGLGGWSNEFTIGKKSGGSWTELAGSGSGSNVTPQEWYDIRFRIVGTDLDLWVNGIHELSASDTEFSSGEIGLRKNTVEVWFDDFGVRRL